MKKTYYEVLGVSQNATQEAIKLAFKSLAKKYHPDNNPDNQDEANKRMQEITEAYVVLSDLQKRIEYDQNFKKIQREQTKTEHREERTPSRTQTTTHYHSYTETTQETESDLDDWIKEILRMYRDKNLNNIKNNFNKCNIYNTNHDNVFHKEEFIINNYNNIKILRK